VVQGEVAGGRDHEGAGVADLRPAARLVTAEEGLLDDVIDVGRPHDARDRARQALAQSEEDIEETLCRTVFF
jgi:hypothetical protein